MFARRFLPMIAALGVIHSVHAGDVRIGDIRISQAYARATVPGQLAAAAYVTIENRGTSPDRLVGASTPAAKSVELHTMSRDGDVMRMREVRDIPVKPGASIAMKPGEGYHFMLLGLPSGLKKDEQFPLTVVFEKAGKTQVSVTVMDRAAVAPGGQEPRGGAHHH